MERDQQGNTLVYNLDSSTANLFSRASISSPSPSPSHTRTDEVSSSRSFARIHRTNLTKQGVLPLTFLNESDYAHISAGDKISTTGLNELLRGDLDSVVRVVVEGKDGGKRTIDCDHALSRDQVEWIKAGSALNVIKAKAQAEKGL